MPTLPDSFDLAKPEVRYVVDAMKAALSSVLPNATFGERERAAFELSNAVLRETLEDDLQAIADGFTERVVVNGVEYARHQSGTRRYHSLVGPLHVSRATYRKVGVRNGPTIVPLELTAGLAERATPALVYSIALGYSRTDMREHLETLTAAHRQPPQRATLERIAKSIAAQAQQDAPSIENQLRHAEELPEGAHAISVGLDRTSVPMSELRPADAPPKARTRKKPLIRRAPPAIDVNFRMAYVGTVSIVDEHGEALVNRRYAIPACDDPSTVANRMAKDVRAALRKNPSLNVGIVQDGAHEMWNVMTASLEPLTRDGTISELHEAIDRYHLLERLGAALSITEPDEAKRSRQLNKYRERFDHDDSTIDSVERYLRKQYRKLSEAKQRLLWEHLVYVRNNRERMRYVRQRLHGLPVGSGVTESAAKTVIAARAKRSGQRWSQEGLRGTLALRSLEQSGRLPDFWQHFSRRYTTNVEAA